MSLVCLVCFINLVCWSRSNKSDTPPNQMGRSVRLCKGGSATVLTVKHAGPLRKSGPFVRTWTGDRVSSKPGIPVKTIAFPILWFLVDSGVPDPLRPCCFASAVQARLLHSQPHLR